MRIKIKLTTDKDYVILPIHHNHIIQSMLYNSLPKEVAKFLHDVGFFYHKRQFKLFTFSKIQSQHYNIAKEKSQTKHIEYKIPISLYISSAIGDFTKSWGETFLKNEEVILGKNTLYLESIEVLPNPDLKEEFKIKTLSPITVYKTFENGKKYYRYYSPSEQEFKQLLKENLRKKYQLITNKEINDFPFDIEPITTKKVLIKYKNFPIEAYEGVFKIKTNPELFKVVFDAGLGAKNSQGFGMIEVLKNG
ncbi:crispr-associated protein Cas6 [Sulfurihydrogenibium azorense Az-Fu1]|uniref:CRISPR-associated endoribonuclease n=1 Tax=Sulfurihydrogenibium azorense (strain DSM 15241 / OCM 825 / Az-Fu1) TaxID=204536 RepID=C1DUQ5_SULAA|nr:CRISPR-associated endoribonuclease Cas6 [Sulfurihydrogenibium azorense]ACN98535.1 crispr-associated protein Cas6 [Sulfurihydrogenibium azorense Az-Fu1]